MDKKVKLFLTIIVILINTLNCSSQKVEVSEDLIETKFKEYFSTEREHIHLHLNKNSYLTNEKIWFKGYITSNKILSIYTTNIHLKIYDNEGFLIDSKLIFAANGFFGGKIDLNSNYKTGIYKIHIYTNYMNNFIEDESSIYDISILNPNESEEITNNEVNLKNVKANFYPESGIFLYNFSNTFGIKIEDCNKNGLEVNDAEILNSENEVISSFSTDKHGIGKFEIKAIDDNYKIKYRIGESEKIELLPSPHKFGVNFSINSYSVGNKIIMKIRKSENKERKLKVLIYQESEANSFTITIPENKNEVSIDIEKSLFFDGVNTIALLDENNTKIGERLTFVSNPLNAKYENEVRIYKKTRDSIGFEGKSNFTNGSLSISILPSESNTIKLNKTINTKYYLDNFLVFPSYISYEELSSKNRTILFEMDRMLLSNESKYKWENINKNPKEIIHEFERGVSIKGNINTLEKKRGKLIVTMKAIGLGINNNAEINDKNEFEFKNVIAVDSTKLYFVILDETRKKINHKIYATLQNNTKNFFKSPFLNNDCEKIYKKTAIKKEDFPVLEGAILLDSVSINVKKDKLKYDNQKGNFYARGFKITDQISNQNRDLLDFISKNGFNVSRTKGYVFINGYNYNAAISNQNTNSFKRGSLGNNFGPAVFVDNIQILDYDALEGYNLSNIDEIYIDKNRNNLTFANWIGSIKIFTKKNTSIPINVKSESIFVKNGFQNYSPYNIPKYTNYNNDGFKKFGSLNWIPQVETDKNGTYKFSIPNLYQNNIRVLIEGLSNNGETFSEVLEINLD